MDNNQVSHDSMIPILEWSDLRSNLGPDYEPFKRELAEACLEGQQVKVVSVRDPRTRGILIGAAVVDI